MNLPARAERHKGELQSTSAAPAIIMPLTPSRGRNRVTVMV